MSEDVVNEESLSSMVHVMKEMFLLVGLLQTRMQCCHCLPPGLLLALFYAATYPLNWYKIESMGELM